MTENASSRTIEPVHQSIVKLLGGQQTFQAPRYQRNFAWGPNQIGAFLRDLDSCLKARFRDPDKPRHHFFGGLVTVEARVANSSRTNLEVVDGQQRLATFAMLISQLKCTLQATANELSDTDGFKETLLQRAANLTSSYELFADEIKLMNVNIPRIQLSQPDQPFFLSLLAGNAPQPNRKSHRLLLHAYQQIGRFLQDLIADAADAPAKAVRLHEVHEVLRSDWTIIHMAAAAKSDAYMLFQVLNDRGVSLTEGELLRSTTLEALERVSGVHDLNEAEEHWNEMLGGEVESVRKTLGALYASQVGTWPSGSTLLDDYMLAFFPAVRAGEPLDTRTSKELMQQIDNLHDDFDRVMTITSGDWPMKVTQAVGAWKRFRLRMLILHLRYMDAMALLVAGCQLTDKVFSNLVLLLERFAFRYATICEGPAERAQEILNRHAVAIRRRPEDFKVNDLKKDLAALCQTYAPDEAFVRALKGLRYSRTEFSNKPIKYLLMTIEDYWRWCDENPQGMPACRDETRLLDFETGSIEHIYAEKMETVDATMVPLLDTLGNMTYLSSAENERVANKPYVQKRPVFEVSALSMNRKIAENSEWNARLVDQRAEDLIARALHIFRI